MPPYPQSLYPQYPQEASHYAQQQMQDGACPTCGNTNRVNKVSVMYDQGTSRSRGTHRRLFSILPTFYSKTSTVTGQAKKVAPPRFLIRYALPLLLLVIIGIVVFRHSPSVDNLISLGYLLFLIYAIVVDIPITLKKRRVWATLYYCEFHDLVFLPGRQQNAVPASQMNKLLPQ